MTVMVVREPDLASAVLRSGDRTRGNVTGTIYVLFRRRKPLLHKTL